MENDSLSQSYLPGIFHPAPEPLSRFLPPIPNNIATAWLLPRVPRGTWVLDPFGTSPRLAVEIARLGYRVLVAANNPIIRFMLEMAANPPPRAELQFALAELAAAQRGTERIEPHIRNLYQTECSKCGSSVMAEAFLWEHVDGGKAAAPAPYARIYTCPKCNTSGEYPCIPGDITRATQLSINPLHRARALERVAPRNDPDRPYAEQAINVYLPRAVYALFTLINKLEGMDLTIAQRRNLTALLLHACDQANTMWKYPVERERRYQLVIPPRFREQNIWLALEQGLDIWSAEGNPGRAAPIPITSWPPAVDKELPPGGIWLFEGRLKSLVDSLSDLKIQAVCTALPRPNRAFWTLSALWAGWLWGHEAVGPFRSVLRRQRYDWAWHTTALTASLSYLGNILSDEVPFLGLMGEFEHNYLAAALVATDLTGFHLDSIALRPEISHAQLIWRHQSMLGESTGLNAETLAIQAATHYLEQRGEPASYSHTFSAAIAGMAQARYFHNSCPKLEAADDIAPDAYTQATAVCKDILSYRFGFLRFSPAIKGKSELPPEQISASVADQPGLVEPGQGNATSADQSLASEKEKSSGDLPESGLVWLRDAGRAAQSPLADRIEMALVNYLVKHPGCTLPDIDAAMCSAFPGLLTPETEYLQFCLDSYAEPDENGNWRLHPQDSPAIRRKDLAEADALIRHLGDRLNFTTQVCPSVKEANGHSIQHTFCWVDRYQEPQYWLYPMVSAIIGEIILRSSAPAGKSLIILPGGRANLVVHKLRRDPRLGHLCNPAQNGWRFIKFRHLRWLEGNPLLTRENLDEQLALDPLTYSTPQLRLL